MSVAVLLALAAAMLGLGAVAELARRDQRPDLRGDERPAPPSPPRLPWRVGALAERLALRSRLRRAGMEERVDVRALIAVKAACSVAGVGVSAIAAPAAPGRLSLLVAAALPVAGFLAPDALLERRARLRARTLRNALPDALDLLATAASAGRAPVAGLAEIAHGEGPLARELSVLVAETSCGAPQGEAFENLRSRVPAQELAAMCGLIERSRRYGSPLAAQLHDQASSMRAAHRRRIEEEAARAAPKIQLAVALLLVPSVLLMIAAGLLANLDRFLAGV